MNKKALEYYQSKEESREAIFEEVIALHENSSDYEFLDLQSKSNALSKGFFELAKLETKDRIEFTKSFWESKIPYSPKLDEHLTCFFSKVEDIGIYLVKKDVGFLFEPHLVYSLLDGDTFFRGHPSTLPEGIEKLKAELQVILPEDYVGFLQIHNGFAKDGDFGMIRVSEICTEMQVVQNETIQMANKPTLDQKPLDPKCLIPFYKASGLSVYQCFYKGWYLEKEMGNLMWSLGKGKKVDYSDPTSRIKKLVFPTFLDWLINYMESSDV